MNKRVFVEDNDKPTMDMFVRANYAIAISPAAADLICFTGGADVNPALYGESQHPWTYINQKRDDYCFALYTSMLGKVPMVGICRGGQFLNVMAGGKMFQHTDGHNLGYGDTHKAIDVYSDEYVEVTSTHHQMMRPAPHGKILLIAKRSTKNHTAKEVLPAGKFDTEAVWYATERSLCYQPHPEEIPFEHECCKNFFGYVNKYIWGL